MDNTVITKARVEIILSWFSGKARVAAAAALESIAASELANEWVGQSRSIRAAMTKANIAKNLAKKFGKELDSIGDYTTPRSERGWEVAHSLRFQSFHEDINFDAIRKNAPEHLVPVIDSAEGYHKAFKPVFDLMSHLDSVRPRPVVTKIGASPTVNKTLNDMGIADSNGSFQVELCPIEWVLVKGKSTYYYVGHMKWPENIKHGASRFQGRCHCQACGHAIKNTSNFVPLVLSIENSRPMSLWVGRDCAKTLFGIDIKGDMDLAGE